MKILTQKEFNQVNFTIGTTIRQKRKEAGLRQFDLAEYLGLSRAAIVNIERGRQSCNIEYLYKIADKLDISVHDLIPVNCKPKLKIVKIKSIDDSYKFQ